MYSPKVNKFENDLAILSRGIANFNAECIVKLIAILEWKKEQKMYHTIYTGTRRDALKMIINRGLIDQLIAICPDSLRQEFIGCLINDYNFKFLRPQNSPVETQEHVEPSTLNILNPLRSFCTFFAPQGPEDDADKQRAESILTSLEERGLYLPS